MKKQIEFNSIKVRIITPVIIVITALALSLTFFSVYNANKIINQNELEKSLLSDSIINNEIERNLDIAESTIKSIVNNPEIAKSFAMKDRERLAELIDPIF
jgi:hypothetical protein